MSRSPDALIDDLQDAEIKEGEGGQARGWGVGGVGAWPQNTDAVWQRR